MSETNDALVFCSLLDNKFDEGLPRRYAPGEARGEEEVWLKPDTEAPDLFAGTPQIVRAIRPKADNERPVAELHPKSYVGHRLQIRQVEDGILEGSERVTGITYFTQTAQERAEGQDPTLRKGKSRRLELPPVRFVKAGGSQVFLSLDPQENYTNIEVVSPEEAARLFLFIGSCLNSQPPELG